MRPVLKDTPLREPTGQDPLRIAVVGDSLAAGVGYFAERVFRPFFVNVIKQGRISTGLSRPDYFDWQAQMRYIMQKARPDLTIVMLGENDQQSLRSPNGQVDTVIGTPGFGPAYRARVTQFAKTATQDGGHVIWIGLPNSSDKRRWPFVGFENQIYRSVVEPAPERHVLRHVGHVRREGRRVHGLLPQREPRDARPRRRRRPFQQRRLHDPDAAGRGVRDLGLPAGPEGVRLLSRSPGPPAAAPARRLPRPDRTRGRAGDRGGSRRRPACRSCRVPRARTG